MLKKNMTITAEVSSVNSTGDGIVKYNDYPLFVKGAVTGDKLEVIVTKTNKTYGFGIIKKIISPSEYRVSPLCSISSDCGGCDMMHIDYNHQLKIKQESVTGNLQRIGGFHEDEYIFEGIIGADSSLYYRNKSQFPIGKDNHGNTVLGFFSRGSHKIIPCTKCIIQNESINKACEIFLDYANKEKITIYNEATHKGILRHLYIRTGNTTDEMLLTVVTNSSKPLPNTDLLINNLKKRLNIKGVIQNINTQKTNLILGNESRILWGENSIISMIGNLKFKISGESFFQVNGEQTFKLYSKALEYADLSGNETAFDLYCGVGSISLFLAQKAKKVIGVEIVEKAIENAKENATINNITNSEFYAGDCGKVVDELISKGEKADVVVVDPPRKGCSGELLELLKEISPQKIVYVSCNSATLSRDVKILKDYGYKMAKVCAVDMFPNSGHVECCVLLCRTQHSSI